MKDPLLYIEHMQVCVDRIKTYTKNLKEEEFLENYMVQNAVIRNFEIIGEASKKLPFELDVAIILISNGKR